MSKKLLECLQPTSRTTKPYDGEAGHAHVLRNRFGYGCQAGRIFGACLTGRFPGDQQISPKPAKPEPNR